MNVMNNPYKLHICPDQRTCEITFFFDDSAAYTLPTRYYPGIEEDVRRNYYAWRAHAVAYCDERVKLDAAINALTACCIDAGTLDNGTS